MPSLNKVIVKTKPPGPRARKLITRDDHYTSPSLPRAYSFAAVRGEDVYVEDADGNVYLDCMAGIAVCSTGHCHPRVTEAICKQASQLIHLCGADFYYEQYGAVAERLANLAPGAAPKKVFLTNSGAEAIESAIKLARFHTGRQRLIAFHGAFHGRTMGALSLTGSKPLYHQGFGPMLPGVDHLPYGYCYRCPFNLEYPSCRVACISFIENVIFHRTVPSTEVAAIFVEPVQGEGGMIVPPPEWLPRLRKLCDEHGIMLVADEVQSGVGRTGKMFACENWNVVPDIICLAKGIASGMPLGAMIARADIMDWNKGSHGGTFGGNPVSCAAALATLDLIESSLMENARVVGEYLLNGLKQVAKTSDIIGDVRGLGLMIGVEFVQDKNGKSDCNQCNDGTGKAPAPKKRDAVVDKCFQKGLLLLGCGPNMLRFTPALTFQKKHADIALDIFAETVAEVEREG